MNDNEHIIVVKDLVKKFGQFTANDRLNFSVRKGEIFGFLGANGAGKTTAIKILSGLSKPTSGQAVVAGFDVARHPDRVKRNIGYMSQHFSMYNDLTVKENFRFYGGIYGLSRKEIKDKTSYYLEKLKMEEFEYMLVRQIPLGWKQKLAFSVANMHDPAVIFLDEPTGGVDPITRRQFWELIYESAAAGTTVFVTTHYMDEAEYCERVSIMSEGRIEAIGSPGELKKQYGVPTMNDVFIKIAR
ncbi:MAG: ABC transporter ATP-binding protein [Bacteroidetes bacterium]|nr:MAG: ABC transporter ATP-binding protein [Bacteroidota bacterium]RLD47973.1 MAG: ABC transporter ATP-binding protein [Bacteroidota bacterium]RLD89250.1 MAG: ABC transporter ATP-binding protein [Bacteroidota bacterium]